MDNFEGKKSKVEAWLYLNGKLIEHTIKDNPMKWVSPSDDPIHQSLLKNIGIGSINPMYIEVNEIQDKNDEYNKIIRFLKKFLEYYAKNNNVPFDELKLEFINYGKTELVYVLTEKDGKRFALLVKQPAVKLGDVYQEMQNLLALRKKDESVVAPIDYFQLGDQELYVTPYINQARCIASYGTWGMYIPEPYYRFEPFSKEQERIVNICMISKLVSLYDFENQEGISCCKLGGGDFMPPKGWETCVPTIKNTLGQLYLIAARKKVKCSFEEYLQIIRNEFSRVTINEDQEKLIVNLRGRVPMQVVDIEEGIHLGKSFIETHGELFLARNYKK